MKKLYFILAALFTFINNGFNAQTITFTGCSSLFSNTNTFTFNKTGTDATGRNIYQTTPLTGDQPCPIGACEFMIKWNNTSSRWEFLADDGTGDFSSPDLIYYNTSASTPNPPAITLGTWMENTTITAGNCGGNLTTTNATMTGTGVQNTISMLGTAEENKVEFRIYPNPTRDYVTITTKNPLSTVVSVYDESGKMLLTKKLKSANEKIDLQNYPKGIYLLKLQSAEGNNTVKIIKQN